MKYQQVRIPIVTNITEARDLIKGLLTRKPKQRLTVDQALKHPWLSKTEKHSKIPLTLIF
jgi:serine/threonine protein kinase